MKNLLLFILFLNCTILNGQSVYTNKTEYQKALQLYYDHLDSYSNCQKKLKFYTEFKYPKSELKNLQGDNWFRLFEPKLKYLKIMIDSDDNRLHPNVTPKGIIYVHWIQNPNSDYLTTKVTNSPMLPNEYEFSVNTLTFTHPGKKPIYVEPKKSVLDSKILVVENKLKKNVDIVLEPKKQPEIVIAHKLYMMPDGIKYTYDQLIVVYPSMKYVSVFKKNLIH